MLGLGRHGSGLAVCRFLAARGISVHAVEENAERLRELKRQQGRSGLLPPDVRLHQSYDETLPRNADLVVVSPAIRPDHPLVLDAVRTGKLVTTEVALFLAHCPATPIGVTGTNGKSTTALTLYRMLRQSGRRVWLGGNIGRSLLPYLPRIRPGDLAVVELSSFQLYWLDRLGLSPAAAVITSLAEDHVNWHGDVHAYIAAKQAIVRYQSPGDWYVVNADCERLRAWVSPGDRYEAGRQAVGPGVRFDDWRLRFQSVGHWARAELPWPAATSAQLAMYRTDFALAAVANLLLGGTLDAILSVLARPRLLPHRMQVIARLRGRVFVDDSAATTPHAAIHAVRSWSGQPLWLILGGDDKGIDLESLARVVAAHARGAALIGRTAGRLRQFLTRCGLNTTAECPNLEAAVAWCWQHSEPGSVVLLSPGCASTDQFRDYRHRGHAFRQAVRALAAGAQG